MQTQNTHNTTAAATRRKKKKTKNDKSLINNMVVVVVDRLRTGDEELKTKERENKFRESWICFARNIGFSTGQLFCRIR